MFRSRVLASLVAVLAVPLLPSTAWAVDSGCNPGDRPGATLLFPHFRVSLGDPAGENTLISVGNDGDVPTVAHVVLWTDRAVPTFAFDLYLSEGDLQTLSLRDVLRGNVPHTGGAEAAPYPGCPTRLEGPRLDSAQVAALAAAHTGRPDADGLCSGSGLAGPDTAVGYVTVDAMNRCTGGGVFPSTEGYFEEGGTGFASNANVLWGDLIVVESEAGFAHGVEAVSIVADAESFGAETGSFYRGYSGGADDRGPLESRYWARFVHGGGFDGGTDLVVWEADLAASPEPGPCGDTAEPPVDGSWYLVLTFYDEDGHLRAPIELLSGWTSLSRLVHLGEGGIEPPVPFGFVEVDHRRVPPCFFPACESYPVQAWVTPVMKASGRYSVGFHATRPAQSCVGIAP